MGEFTIAQITDLHLVGEEERAYGVNVRENFLKILESITSYQSVDHIVLTGDICFSDADPEIYAWVKTQLDNTNIPYSIVPGNHDDISLMREVFDMPDEYLKNDELYYHKDFGRFQGFFLDTSKKSLSESQVQWLKHNLETAGKDCLIFMHHPPAKAGIRFMDNFHALQNCECLQDMLEQVTEDEIHIFCGHYHVEKEYKEKNMSIFITPSAIYQFDHVSEEFLIDSFEIGWRKITWHTDGIDTSVRYVVN